MYVVRNVFTARAGQGGALAQKFKAAGPLLVDTGVARSVRVLTDVVGGFWTVVVESETDDLGAYLDMATEVSRRPDLGEALAGYHELVEKGHREVFKVV